VLAVEDLPIREFRDVIDVQAVVRDHPHDLRLRVRRASEEPAEVRVGRSDASL
jgi:hypothetical protein